MSDVNIKKIRFDIPGCPWEISLSGVHDLDTDGVLTATNFVLARPDGRYFHTTFVEGEALDKEKKPFKFWQPMSFEHDTSKNKVGDVVLIFRKSPDPHGRWMVQFELEDVYVDEKTTQKVVRTKRSSLDNVIQAIGRTVVEVGRHYSNPRRQGGNSIALHYVHAPWSPQLAAEMVDVFDYVQSLDSNGKSAFLSALQHMPDQMANEIFQQIRTPHYNGLIQE